MDTINLQHKTGTAKGVVEPYWFENENIGLPRTLFYRITIPLQAFDSGLEYEDQPVETEIVIEWLQLDLTDMDDLDHVQVSSKKYEKVECSIYLGWVHNICEILQLDFEKIEGNDYRITGEIYIDFEWEKIAKNEKFSFQTIVSYEKHQQTI